LRSCCCVARNLTAEGAQRSASSCHSGASVSRCASHCIRSLHLNSSSSTKSIARRLCFTHVETSVKIRKSFGARKSDDDMKSDDGNSSGGRGGNEGKTEVFVKNLSFNTTDSSLKNFFAKYGTVTRVNILKRDDGKSKGIGFISFENATAASAAFADADNMDLDDRKISINWANDKKERTDDRGRDRGDRDRGDRDRGDRGDRERPRERSRDQSSGGDKHTVFVGNLGYKTTDRTIRDFFRDCGKVLDIRIAKNEEGRSKGFCHVDFSSRDAIDEAMKLNGNDLDGRQIKVDESKSGGSGGSGGFRGGRGGGSGGFRGGRGGGRGRGRY